MYCSSYSAPRSQATAVSNSAAASSADRIGPRPTVSIHRTLACPAVYRSAMPTIGYRLLAAVLALTAAGRRGRATGCAPPRHQHHQLVPFPAEPRSGGAACLSRRCRAGGAETRRLHLHPLAGATRAAGGLGSAGRCHGAGAAARARGGRGTVRGRLASGDQPSRPGRAARNVALAGTRAAALRSGGDISRGAERAGVRRRPRCLGQATA